MTLFDMPDLLIMPLALAIDLVFGEPPNRFHPVVWMGKTVGLLMKTARRPLRSHAAEFLYGLLVTLLVAGLFAAATWLFLAYVKSVNFAAYVLLGAIILKTAFSLRALRAAAVRVKDLLRLRRLPEARAAVRSLVGRDTAQLDDGQVVSAAVESVAENSCDSFVAPLFFFLFLGVPGAVAYRAINTLDNTIGFRGRYEYLGKFAARLDDVVNFVPARVAAAILVLVAWVVRQDADQAWRVMLRDRRKTASPNGGWTMAAMAGALGVRLEKVGHYTLGEARRPLLPAVIDGSVTMLLSMALVWTAVVILGKVALYAAT
jgi:adenosylcobinamide-phosphate synthase